MLGLAGRFVEVDLTTQLVSDFVYPKDWADAHLGGLGLCARILLDILPPRVDPLGAENVLAIGIGPFQGTRIAGASRNVVMAVSPVTGDVSASFVGGYFPHALGKSGFDGLLIKGVADSPVYVLMEAGKVFICDASMLWGLPVLETVRWLEKEHGDVRVSCIGPGGERGVQYACILNDTSRAAGRPGFGAVMGSKQLKAVVVRGDTPKAVFDEKRVSELRASFAKWLMADPATQKRKRLGTAKCIVEENDLGLLPTKNFRAGQFEHVNDVSGERLLETILQRRDTCEGCPVSCKRAVKTSFLGQSVIPEYGGMEYETVAAFSSLCLVHDLGAVALAGQKCNALGIDTIATGVAIAAAMEATERGLLSDHEGIAWGDGHAMVELVDKIGNQEGMGALLSKGMHALEQEWGNDFVLHVKGQAVPMHDVRGKKGMAISFATSPRGANHMEGLDDEMFIGSLDPTPQLGVTGEVDWQAWDRKPELCIVYENLMAFTNSLVMCAFVSLSKAVGSFYPYDKILEMLRAITGVEYTTGDIVRIGHGNYGLMRELEERTGGTPMVARLPTRFFNRIESGPLAGEKLETRALREAVDRYQQMRDQTADRH